METGKRKRNMKLARVLVVGQQMVVAELRRSLSGDGFRIMTAQTQPEALALLERKGADIVIIGTRLAGGGDGVALLEKVKALYPSLEVIMLVGQWSVDAAVKSMKLGACDCVPKPVDVVKLSASIQRVCQARRLRERTILEDDPASTAVEFVGESKQIREVKRLISLVGPSVSPVMILGETGTGKELVARAIHRASNRSHGPLVALNASALPENILVSELFGYKKGAFTGAESDKAGLFDIADQGTFFVDEVGDMHLGAQAKLLRVVETGTFRKLGDTLERKVDIRLVCATNKDLQHEMGNKAFREDLFYRLSTFVIHVPPLRERKSDIPLLADYFLRRTSEGKESVYLSREAVDLLMAYSWPGNVRELANVLERARLLTGGGGEIHADKLSLGIRGDKAVKTFAGGAPTEHKSILLLDAEREHIQQVLGAAGGNKARAARVLGISRTKLYNRLG